MSVIFIILLSPTVSLGKLKVGIIYTGNIPYYRKMNYAFAREFIKQLPGNKKVNFLRQYPAPDPIAWSNAARKLVVRGVDLIVSYGYPATDAALSHPSNIPIVYAGVYSPNETINESNRKSTGCGYNISLKTILENLTKTTPIKKMHVIYSHFEDDSILQLKEIAQLAEQKNINMIKLNITSDEDLKQLYDIKDGEALFITGSAFAHEKIESILSIAQTKKVPTVDIFPGSEEQGVLINFYQDPEKMGMEAGMIAAKIMAGAKPDMIEPVVMTESDLIVNVKEANRLGSTIPDQLVSKANKVIK